MKKSKLYILLPFILVFFYSCSNGTEVDGYTLLPYKLDFTGFSQPNLPEDNQLTEQGVSLGRKLFYEKSLSKDNLISCASCHEQKNAFSDKRRFSIGVRKLPGKRQAMAIFNMAWNTNDFFWDGRAHLLRDQALMPIEDELEMDETIENVIEKLKKKSDYKLLFNKIFPIRGISAETISLALEQFMNSIISNQSKYDRYLRKEATLTTSEERGRILFFKGYDGNNPKNSGANCAQCHNGANFENNEYMNNGLDLEVNFKDIGREKVTQSSFDRAKFKVPSLRNIEVTAPYMHDGRFKTLEEVIDHYNDGVVNSPTLNLTLASISKKGLELTEQDKQDLIAFLKTLTDTNLLENPKFSNPFK